MSDTPEVQRTVPRWVYVLVGLVILGGLVAGVAAAMGGSSDPEAGPKATRASGTPSDVATGGPSPTASGSTDASPGASATTDPDAPASGPVETTRPDAVEGLFGDRPVEVSPPGAEAEPSPGITVRVVAVSDVTAAGTGVGEYAGPAVLVTLEITNGTKAATSLDQSAVTAYLTTSLDPVAGVASDGAADPFAGSLAAGKTVRGSYVFVSPGTSAMSIGVLTALDAPVVVFDGILPANG